jgi:hypothetical protein
MPSHAHHTPFSPAGQVAADDLWSAEVLPLLPADLELQAKLLGAFTRRRGLACASDLLRALLAYVLLTTSFQHLGAWAVLAAVADLSAVAWHKRLQRSGPWLSWLVGELLAVPPPPPTLRLVPHGWGNLLLVDATTLGQVGGSGDDWRLHTAYNFTVGRLVQITCTDRHGGEHLGYYRLQPGDIVVADGGYGYRSSIATVRRQQAHLVTRIQPATCPFELPEGGRLDVAAALRRRGPTVREWEGWCTDTSGERYRVRLLAAKLPPAAARQARARVRRSAQKHGRQLQTTRLQLADWVLVLTTLPSGSWPAEAVLRAYRVRWQVELVFKRLKSGLEVGTLRGRTRASLEASVSAVLVGWLLQTGEAAQLRARLGSLGRTDGWVVSSWGLTTLSMDLVRQQVRGSWGRGRLVACLARLQRFLTRRVRADRVHQESTARAWLARLPVPRQGAGYNDEGGHRLSR